MTMQTETTAPAVDTTATAPAGQVTTTTQTTTTPPASGQDGAAGTSQPTGTAAPAAGQNADQGTQQGTQGQADGTTTTDSTEAERDEAGRFKSKIQKRIDELTHARHAAEREAARWRSIAEGSQKATPAPQAHEFATDEEYEAALLDHRIDERARQQAAANAKHAAEQYQQDAEGTIDATYDQRAQEAARRIPDFVDVVGKADIQITHDMLGALKQSAHGPDIVYELAKNPAEAARIAGLPAAQMYMALGAMEARAAATATAAPAAGSAPAAAAAPAARTTNAPPPATPAGSGASAPPNTDPANMSMDEYKAWRKGQGSKYIS
jgi:hypothetical protein